MVRPMTAIGLRLKLAAYLVLGMCISTVLSLDPIQWVIVRIRKPFENSRNLTKNKRSILIGS